MSIAVSIVGLLFYFQATTPSIEERRQFWEQRMADSGHMRFPYGPYLEAAHQVEELNDASPASEWVETITMSLIVIGVGAFILILIYDKWVPG